ncbi:MAG: hypothetical protein ABIQ99_07315 [Thermoflexales bacterium]
MSALQTLILNGVKGIPADTGHSVLGAVTLADIRLAQGRTREALRTYEQAMQLATAQGAPALAPRGTADIYVGLSELHREHNDLGTATEQLQRGKALGEHTGFLKTGIAGPWRWLKYEWPREMRMARFTCSTRRSASL